MAFRKDTGQARESRFKLTWTRDMFIYLLFAVLMVFIFGRLVFVQVINSDFYASRADKSHMVDLTLPAKRGTIYDRNGEVLASSIEATTVYVDPGEVENPQAVATVIHDHLGEAYNLSYEECLEKASMPDSSFAYIVRRCDKDMAAALRADLEERNLIGVHYQDDTLRVYPNEDLGSQVVGKVNVDGDGVEGLELEYDTLVGGEDGKVKKERGLQGIPIANGIIEEEPAIDGQDIITSLDIRLQKKAEESLEKMLAEYEAQGGSVTIMDAATGELYVACSLKRDKRDDGTVRYVYDEGKIWSITDAYEPGSTFKTLTADSILSNSKVTADTTFTVPPSLQVYDAVVTDSHEHGTENMTFRDIIAESSNIGTVLASRKVTNDDLYATYKNFGFGTSPGTDFPGTSAGILEQTKDWDGVQEANITFGQGVLVSALQLVRAYGAIEQQGSMHVPHFLMDVPHDEAKALELVEPLNKKTKATSKKTAKKVTSLLKSVVERGTGEAAAIDRFDVVGKTGTAEVAGDNGRYGDGYILSFGGWLEGSSSDLVCLVTAEKPKTEAGGGDVCGPVFADIMQFAIERYQISP